MVNTRDLLTRGFICGTIAGIIKDLLNLFSFHVLHFTHILYTDFSAVLLFGNKSASWIEFILAYLTEIGWSGVLGVLLIYLLEAVSYRLYIFKSIFFAIQMWFFQYAIIVFFHVTPLFFISGLSSASNLITSAVDGLIMGLIFGWFKKKELEIGLALGGKRQMASIYGDRFTVGCLGGITSGIVMSLLNYISFYLFHFAKARYIDVASMLIHGRFAVTLAETIVSQIGLLVFCGFLGICFTYFITLVSSKNIYFKGWFFSVFSWFMLYAIFTLFKVPRLVKVPWQTPASNLITASVFGLILAWIVFKVETALKVKEAPAAIQPASGVQLRFDELKHEVDGKVNLRKPNKIK